MPTVNPFVAHWTLDSSVDFLNHGSFGACPRVVLAYQQSLRDEMEREPVDFLARRIDALLDDAREQVAAFIGADADGMVVVPNATTGVSTVLRALESDLGAGDELLVTDHEYNACRNAIDFVAGRSGARVVVVAVPFPLAAASEVTERLLDAVTPRTRLALVDHVTSPTGLVLPIAEIACELQARNVDLLVDGAHALGMLPLRLSELGVAWYTGNCHKWLCSPKGAAILWAREDKREALRPLVVSHGHNRRRPGRSRLHDEFDWPGTTDPTAFLSVPECIRVIGGMVPGGWEEVRQRNHQLVLRARDLLLGALGIAAPAPDDMLGSLAAVPLPPGGTSPAFESDPVHQELRARFAIEVPVFGWPWPPARVLRVSAQLYNDIGQYARLAGALGELLPSRAVGVLDATP